MISLFLFPSGFTNENSSGEIRENATAIGSSFIANWSLIFLFRGCIDNGNGGASFGDYFSSYFRGPWDIRTLVFSDSTHCPSDPLTLLFESVFFLFLFHSLSLSFSVRSSPSLPLISPPSLAFFLLSFSVLFFPISLTAACDFIRILLDRRDRFH